MSEDSVEDKIVVKKGVKIIAWNNLAVKIASDSSRLYAKNLYNFLLRLLSYLVNFSIYHLRVSMLLLS